MFQFILFLILLKTIIQVIIITSPLSICLSNTHLNHKQPNMTSIHAQVHTLTIGFRSTITKPFSKEKLCFNRKKYIRPKGFLELTRHPSKPLVLFICLSNKHLQTSDDLGSRCFSILQESRHHRGVNSIEHQ